jgi:hypothetical protein
MVAVRWGILLICAFLTGCDAPMIDHIPRTDDEESSPSPIVVVGLILSDTVVRYPVPSHLDPRLSLEFRRMKLRVENVLRGDPMPGVVTVQYFAFDNPSGSPAMGLWTLARPWPRGYRRVFWLRRDDGVLRTSCDGRDSCTVIVASGAHPHYVRDSSQTLGRAIADLELTRGDGVVDADFAKQIEEGTGTDGVPKEYLFERLRSLAATEVPVVRAAACRVLASYRQRCVSP